MNCKKCGQAGQKNLCTGERNAANKDRIYFTCPSCINPKTGTGSLFIGFETQIPSDFKSNLNQTAEPRIQSFSELVDASRRIAQLQSDITSKLTEVARLAELSKTQILKDLDRDLNKI